MTVLTYMIVVVVSMFINSWLIVVRTDLKSIIVLLRASLYIRVDLLEEPGPSDQTGAEMFGTFRTIERSCSDSMQVTSVRN